MGWPVPQWPLYRRACDQAHHMDAVMSRLGIDAAEAIRKTRGAAFAEARGRCFSCLSSRQCSEWLSSIPASSGAPPTCPNADFFRAYSPGKR